MNEVVSIYKAKTNLSKLVKKASEGSTIYIGSYGRAQAILSPMPKKKEINIGIWADKKRDNAYVDIVSSDPDIVKSFNKSINKEIL